MAKEKRTSIGGQALIEGIMMRGPHKTVMSCRLPDGGISTEEIEWGSASKKYKILTWPIIRGAVALVDSMLNGYKALMLSAERSGMLDEEEQGKASPVSTEAVAEDGESVDCNLPAEESESTVEASDETSVEESENETPIEEAENDDPVEESCDVAVASADEAQPSAEAVSDEEPEPTADKKKKESVFEAIVGVVSLILGVGLAIVLFMWLPSTAFNLINRLEGIDITSYRALFEGVIKIMIFVLYMFAVSFMKDIRRVFMYHGAEHKSIFCYEKGLELTVENVRSQKRFHPRCGTSFMILMLIVSIVISYLVLTFVPGVKWLAENYSWIWVIIKILMMPLMCGIGYELIRICGRYDNFLTRAISAPGVWLQHISTKEPDDSMIEVAIESIKAVIPENSEDDDLCCR